jgi:four helix bundle protein
MMENKDDTGHDEQHPSVWKLVVFQKAYQAALDVHKIALGFPQHERFELSSQLRRSSKGICANLTEGRGRQQGSQAEFRRFVLMALGSADETLLWIRFARDLATSTRANTTTWLQGMRRSPGCSMAWFPSSADT